VRIRIGSRGSRLARVQSYEAGRLLEARGHRVEYVFIKTSGDAKPDLPYERIGSPGIFVRQIEAALLEERIDVAVHSYKDLPSESPPDLVVAAVPERLDARDLLVTLPDRRADSGAIPLREGSRVGTASSRRHALLRALRPDLEISLLRGNLPTRFRRLGEGRFDAIVLASAGVRRLMRSFDDPDLKGTEEAPPVDRFEHVPLDPEVFVPAPSQGAIAVQVRAEDAILREMAGALNDPSVEREVATERALLARMEGGCSVPLGAWCRSSPGGGLELVAALGTEGGLVRSRSRGTDPSAVAEQAYRELRSGEARA
jgi:hydroxymethylbilane synthase